MFKKLILLIVLFIFLSSFRFTHASFFINEIMYDLSGADSTNSKSREWIEIYNSGGEVAIDATTWRIYDGSANRTINNQTNFTISAGAYVIFAGNKDTFLADHTGFSGIVYDTGITSLNNTGAILKLLDQDGNILDSVTYASSHGGAGDGNTLQKVSSGWLSKLPSPGLANEAPVAVSGDNFPASSSSTQNPNTGSTTTSTNTSTEPKKPVEQKIRTEIAGDIMALVGIPLTLKSSVFGHKGEPLYYGKYFWNFGDGDSKEVRIGAIGSNDKFTHTYFYPGDYTITLEYYSSYTDVPDASSKIRVKVMPANIIISKVGDDKDFFVELSNNTDYDEDISKWMLASDNKNFILPRGTILESKNKIMISGRVTGLSLIDKNSLKLFTSEGEIAFSYGDKTETIVTAVKIANTNSTPPNPPRVSGRAKGEVYSILKIPESKPVALANLNLQADVNAIVGDAIPKTPSNSPYMSMILLAFLGLSGGAVYFIRQKKIIPMSGEDFNILDE